MVQKDVAPGTVRRSIENPRIIIFYTPIELRKWENQINAELVKAEDCTDLLKAEEEYIENLCRQILDLKPDLIITEQTISHQSWC